MDAYPTWAGAYLGELPQSNNVIDNVRVRQNGSRLRVTRDVKQAINFVVIAVTNLKDYESLTDHQIPYELAIKIISKSLIKTSESMKIPLEVMRKLICDTYGLMLEDIFGLIYEFYRTRGSNSTYFDILLALALLRPGSKDNTKFINKNRKKLVRYLKGCGDM